MTPSDLDAPFMTNEEFKALLDEVGLKPVHPVAIMKGCLKTLQLLKSHRAGQVLWG